MGAHLIIFGPSTAGKTSLMLGLRQFESEYQFTVDRTWTTRPRRPHENDEENVFVSHPAFEANRHRFVFTFNNWHHKYGITPPEPLSPKEVRMRILRPTLARQFSRLVAPEPVVFCGVAPFSDNPAEILWRRDPRADPAEVIDRVERFHDEELEAVRASDIRFRNRPGLNEAIPALGSLIVDYLYRTGL